MPKIFRGLEKPEMFNRLKDLKDQYKQGEMENKGELNLKMIKEIADSSKNIPIIGGIIDSVYKQGYHSQEFFQVLLHGQKLNKSGQLEKVQLSKRGVESLKTFVKGEAHRFKVLATLALFFEAPELALIAKGGKIGKAAKFARTVQKARRITEDVGLVKDAVKEISTNKASATTAVKLIPMLLSLLGIRLKANGSKKAAVEATRIVTHIARQVPKHIESAIAQDTTDTETTVSKTQQLAREFS